jgi:hypothetical protein
VPLRIPWGEPRAGSNPAPGICFENNSLGRLAPIGHGSHRKWRGLSPEGNVVVIGLVEVGKGTLKPYMIRDMIKQLRENRLLPPEVE